MRLAYFVSPHGFGHAARACAVMEALWQREPALNFQIYSRVPEWFFRESLTGPFHYHSLMTDIGLVQDSPLREDLDATVAALERFLPFEVAALERLAAALADCRLVLCDIAPLGIAAAKRAGIASVLVENFTWDWIYQDYLARAPRLAPLSDYLRAWFEAADYRIQTRPCCQPAVADFVCGPISRPARTPPEVVRAELGIAAGAAMILITMGGIPARHFGFLERRERLPESCWLVVPGAAERETRSNQLLSLPHHSRYYHPDLVAAADLVVAKLGYSTVSEVYAADVPLLYIPRPGFRESAVLARFADEQLASAPLKEADFHAGTWLDGLSNLLENPRQKRLQLPASAAVAGFIWDLL